MRYAVFVYLILFIIPLNAQNEIKVYGKVTDSLTNQPLQNSNIIIEPFSKGTSTDEEGSYTINLPKGKYKFIFSYVGYESKTIEITLSPGVKKYKINAALKTTPIDQQEVNIVGEKYPPSTNVREIKGENIQKMPTVLDDVLRSVKILPGVVSNDELSTGYNVRGGNYDQNLIYLNGYEIHRPFLIREGLEESQSLVNADLVKELKFFGGAFPANLGDKISSVLEVDYKLPLESQYSLSAKANLLRSSITVSKKIDNLQMTGGIRYAYPSLFGNRLQRKGNYNPSFYDFQLFSKYGLTSSSNIELLIINAVNDYDLKPDNWKGHFQIWPYDVKEISIDFDGIRNSSFQTGLYGLKYQNKFNDKLLFNISTSFSTDYEKEKTSLDESIFYSFSAYEPEKDKSFLKYRFENVNNSLNLKTYEIKLKLVYLAGVHTLESGFELKSSNFSNSLFENTYEEGPDSSLELPLYKKGSESQIFNSTAFYVQDLIKLSDLFNLNAGSRFLYYNYNKEFLISPRISLYFTPGINHTISLSTGYYFQPPFVYELRNNKIETGSKLKSQKSFHIIAGWDYRKNNTQRYQFEIYYKKNFDLIPFNIEKMQIQYQGNNSLDGYTYGFDFQYEGEIVEGMKSWVGYSYLNSKEKPKDNSTGYIRSLLDQTHTFKVFLQDKIRKIPNFQSHVRLLFGTGLLYHPKIALKDEDTGLTYLETDYNSVAQFPFYFRLDMGLTFRFDLDETTNITLIAEVLNVFNKNNIADYDYYTVFPISPYPIAIPQIFSKRFFNVGVNMNF